MVLDDDQRGPSSSRRSRKRSPSSCDASGSRPAVASSSSSRSGPAATAAAISTMRIVPYGSSPTPLVRRGDRARTAPARAGRRLPQLAFGAHAAAEPDDADRGGVARQPRLREQARSRRRLSGRNQPEILVRARDAQRAASRRVAPHQFDPAVLDRTGDRRRPDTALKKVDLPAPFAPIRPTISPRRTSSDDAVECGHAAVVDSDIVRFEQRGRRHPQTTAGVRTSCSRAALVARRRVDRVRTGLGTRRGGGSTNGRAAGARPDTEPPIPSGATTTTITSSAADIIGTNRIGAGCA